MTVFDFRVVPGPAVRRIVAEHLPELIDLVADVYRLHGRGDTVNPPSQFLRFPDNPSARIISLPAYVGGARDMAGMKWIASFPENIANDVPRASALLVLNDTGTGYPFACLEASDISSTRTAASAVLAARTISQGTTIRRLAVIGAGTIARRVVDTFAADGWTIDTIVVHDLDPERGKRFADTRTGFAAETAMSVRDAITGADMVVLTTTASRPHITDADMFVPGQTVLHLSLRDLSPEIILEACNIVDDVDHSLREGTSLRIAEEKYGHRRFVTGTLAELLNGDVRVDPGKPTVFSPFGLGVLDVAVGGFVYRLAVDRGDDHVVPSFFAVDVSLGT
jgi:ornithine cyclodeaminase